MGIRLRLVGTWRSKTWARQLVGVAGAVLLLFTLMPVAARAEACVPLPPYGSDFDRFGFNVVTDHGMTVDSYSSSPLTAGWYLDYKTRRPPIIEQAGEDNVQMSTRLAYVPVLRVWDLGEQWQERLQADLLAYPGALWLVGNEPDRSGQDGTLAAEYAEIYHDVYQFIKSVDPSAQVAIAGVVQATPLRMRYLDQVLTIYREKYGVKLPTDFWNIHGFILREGDTWGAGIPPGLSEYADEGQLYDIVDHASLEIFQQQIVAFRQWMADRGYQKSPLIMTEYGVLMPPSYGFPYEVVRDYMLGSFDFFLTETDEQIGMPADDYRLVQAWAWYSMNDYIYEIDTAAEDPGYDIDTAQAEAKGFNGSLVDHDTGQLTDLGRDWIAYTTDLYSEYTDVSIRQFELIPSSILTPTAGMTVTLRVSIMNRGNVPATDVGVRFRQGNTLLQKSSALTSLDGRCQSSRDFEYVWKLEDDSGGLVPFEVEVFLGNASQELSAADNRAIRTLLLGSSDALENVYLPMASK